MAEEATAVPLAATDRPAHHLAAGGHPAAERRLGASGHRLERHLVASVRHPKGRLVDLARRRPERRLVAASVFRRATEPPAERPGSSVHRWFSRRATWAFGSVLAAALC